MIKRCTFLAAVVAIFLNPLVTRADGPDDDKTVKDDFWVTVTAFMPPPPPIPQQVLAPTDHAVLGTWGSVIQWPHVPVSAAILPNGKILTWASNEKRTFPSGPEFTHAAVWDPTTGQFTTVNNENHDMFCASLVMLEDGRVMVPGGRNTVKMTSTFDFTTNQWAQIEDMVDTRWYPTTTLLGDGNVVVASGSGTGKNKAERWDPVAGWTRLTGINWSGIADASGFESHWWPYNFLAPNGKVFHAGPTDAMHWLDPDGSGTLNAAGTTVPGTIYPKHGASAMYDEGKLLIVGGAGSVNGGVTSAAYTVDLNGMTPIVAAQTTMKHLRRFPNAVTLPNGEVMVIGGNKSGMKFSDNQSVVEPEIWNPTTGTWRVAANISIPRNYHSVALMMPDGRVFSAGGGLSGNSADHLDAQIYTPPNLYNTDGSLAARPAISTAPAAIGYDVTMTVEATPGMAKFSLVRMTAITHGLATDCRFLPVTNFVETSPGVYAIPTHANSNVVTPGYWMLFALDQNGVHSEAAVIQFSKDAPPPPATEITMTTVPAGATASGNEVQLALNATGGTNPQFTWNFGDGSAEVTSGSPMAAHTFSGPGRYDITVVAKNGDGSGQVTHTFTQVVHAPLTTEKPQHSGTITTANGQIWNVNPDNNTVTVFNATTFQKLAEIPVGTQPVGIAAANAAGADEMWIVNKRGASISVINPTTLAVSATISLPRASRPSGLVVDPAGEKAYLALEATGKLARIDIATQAIEATLDLGVNIRHISFSGDGVTLLVSRFITPPLPLESTANPVTQLGGQKFGGEVIVVELSSFIKTNTIILEHSNDPDASDAGRGIPNYLGVAAISPDGTSAWVPSKQDNIKRGQFRDGNGLNHDNTVRSIASRIDLGAKSEVYADRIDFDNAGMATSATFGPFGAHLFVTLEGSRAVAVVDAYSAAEILRFDVGFTPRGLTVSEDGNRLFVHNFLDRSVSVFEIAKLIHEGENEITPLSVLPAVATESLAPMILAGKKLFHDSRDNRLALQEYISCATCHEDGEQDGRVWDLTGFGEGLRNTISLRGHSGTGQGPLHWSANFDEVQDFEGQMRDLSAALGLMSDTHFATTSDPLGAPKVGISADLDALAAFVTSLSEFDESPHRPNAVTLSAEAEAGKQLFISKKCAECHSGPHFTDSAPGVMHDVGTLKASSGKRLAGPLTELDTPTLREVWATAPYLHDGSANSLAAAIAAHTENTQTTTAAEQNSLAAYLREIDRNEPAPASGVTFDDWQTSTPGAGSGPNSNGDGDQFTDLMEYALGLDPASGITSSAAFTVSPANASVTRPVDRAGVTTVLEVSPDLITWTALGSPAVTANGDGTETLDFAGLQNIPGLGSGIGFARLRVTSGTDTALSPVQGWVQHQIKTGHQSFGITLVKPAAYSGTLASTTSAALVFSENTVAAALDPAHSYYAEITTGPHVGHRFQIDSTASAGAQIAVDFAAKTTTRATFPTGLTGARVIIRSHFTLGGVFDKAQFHGGTKSSQADRILLYGPGGYEPYFLLKYGSNFDFWVQNGDSSLSSQQNQPIPPGEGGFYIRRGADTTITITGEVRANDFVQALRTGYNLVAEPTPITRTPSNRGLTLQAGFTGGTKSSNSDQFTVWNGDLTPGEEGFTIYYLLNFNNFQYWTRSGDSTLPNEGNSPHFDHRHARFILPTAGAYPEYRVSAGWSE